MNRPLPNLLSEGFGLAMRNWPFVLWAYGVNLVFSLLAGIPFAAGLAPYLDHSLAAQRIAGTIDLSSLLELAIQLRTGSFFSMAVHTAGYLNLLQLLVLFFVFAGTIFVYVSAEPPKLSVLLRGGVAYFWRFARVAVLAGGIAILILGTLLAVRAAVLDRLGARHVDRQMFVYWAITGAVVVLVALLLRLWWDLVEVYTVRNAMDGELQVRYALLPASRMLLRYFFPAAGCFLLAGLAGLGGLAVCLYIWKEFIPAHQVWLACIFAQLGIFLMLASRFWQRGIEAALVLSADPPRIAEEEIIPMVEEEPTAAEVEALSGLSEPTLRDLVQKLRTQPLASPEVILPPRPSPDPLKPDEPQVSLLELHDKKFPLGGIVPGEKSAPSAEKPKMLEDPKKPTLPDKKP